MKLHQLLLTLATLLTLSATCQDTLVYPHCNCIDIIDVLTPSPSGSYTRFCDEVLIEKGAFEAGSKTGEWLSYSLDGDLIKKISYSNGTLNGEVTYYYSNGKMKLNGIFSDGVKSGDWKFYNQKERVLWSQSFKDGTPVGKSLIYDQKGKKVVVSYDHDKKKYEVNNEEYSLFEDAATALQDPTSTGWFIILFTDPTKKTAQMSLDQKNIESELFMSLLEIPIDMFDSYLNINYNAELTFENFALKSIELKREAAKGDDYPMFVFSVMTNDPENLVKVEYSEFTLALLDSKIKEALTIFTPWQIENGKFNMAFLYVINKIEGREVIDR